MRNNHSAPLTTALANLSSDEIISDQNRAARRRGRWRFGPLRFWLAAFLAVAAPVLAASKPTRNRDRSWSAPARLDPPSKAGPSRCPPTATPPSWAGLPTTGAPGRRGSTRAAAASGPSRAPSWSAPARLEAPDRASPSRCPPTATPPSWVGLGDNTGIGAAWVYTRSGGVWTQQGTKLVGTGAVGHAGTRWLRRAVRRRQHRHRGRAQRQPGTGAAWVFTRSGGVWTQQGSKLVGTGAVGHAGTRPLRRAVRRRQHRHRGRGWPTTRAPGRRGSTPAAAASGPSRAPSWSAPARLEPPDKAVSVALSADGNTAIVGGPGDNWRRRGGVGLHAQRRRLDPAGQQAGRHRRRWTRRQGYSVALSADGNTAIVGGAGDNSNVGAAWVHTRSGGVWTQQGSKLVGTGAVGSAETRQLRRAVRRRQHGHRGRACRQRGHRGSVDSHSQRRCLDQNTHPGTGILNVVYYRSAPMGRCVLRTDSFAGLEAGTYSGKSKA